MAKDPNAGRDTHSMGTRTDLVPTVRGYGFSMTANQGSGSNWFGPLAPMPAQAPVDVKGRILDFPSGYNLQQGKRPLESISFDMLRGFADGLDILRLIIETRKDQLGRMDWNIAVREKFADKAESLKAKVEAIEEFFIRPDGENFWDEWLRMILEDLFVLDAPAIHRHKTVGGELIALVPIDGSTIKRVIDDYGRTPVAPYPAYQQVLHGMPAVNYTTEELLYRPRNRRTHKIFGYSPVEQILMTINIALRRQIWQLQSFTEGNIPEALIGTPATWTPDQVRGFQEWFDSLLAGNTGERRRARFVPGDVAKSFVATKPDELFGAAEDWLARVCCFAFSVSPQPFIKMMNRATAATAQEVAVEEGLAPIQSWVKNLIDTIIIEDFGEPMLEFMWADEDELDPNIRSQISDREIKNGLRTINEQRTEDGLAPYPEPEFDRPMQFTATTGYAPIALTPEEKAAKDAAALAAATPPPSQGGDNAPDSPPGQDGPPKPDDKPAPKPADDKGVAKKSAVPFLMAAKGCGNTHTRRLAKADVSHAHGKSYVDPDRKDAMAAIKSLRKTLALALVNLGKSVGKQLRMKLAGLGKADNNVDIDELLKSLNIEFDSDLGIELRDELSRVYATAGEAALGQVGVKITQDLTNQINDRAISWAESHAAELVSLDDEFFLGGATLDMLRSTIVGGMQDNLSSDEIATLIEEGYAFSEERATLIAMTEVATANSQGSLAGYGEAVDAGVKVRKSWLILDDACDICQENEAEGIIDLDEDFPSGDSAPPAHPNCRCVIVPEVEEGVDVGDISPDETDIGGDGDMEMAAPVEELAKIEEVLEDILTIEPEPVEEEVEEPTIVTKGDWDEDSHTRDDNGRFGSGGGAIPDSTRSSGWTAASLEAADVHPEIGKVMSPDQVQNLRDVIEAKGDQEAVLKAMDPIYSSAGLAAPQTMPLDGNGRPPEGFFDTREYNVNGERVGLEPAIEHLVAGAENFSSGKDQPPAMLYEKQAYIILGPSAAGKSGLAESIAIRTGSAIVDSDEAKKIAFEYNGGIGANAVHEESSLMAQMVEKDLVDKGANIIVPTVGATEKGPLARIERLQAAGYKVTLVNAYVTKDVATQRMANRAISTGRPIGADYVRGVGDRPSKTYESLKNRADGFMRIDANGEKGHERITEVHNGVYTVGGTLGGKHGH